MRKIFVPLVAVLLTANIAWAEKPVPPAEYYQAGAQVPSIKSPSAPSEVHLSGSLTLNQLAHKNGTSLTAKRVGDLIGKTDALQKETAGLKDEVGKLSTGLATNTKAVDEAGKNISGLITAVENTAEAMEGMKDNSSQNFWLTLAGIGLLLILLVVVLFRIRAANSVNEERANELLNVVRGGFQTVRVNQLATQNEVVATRADVAKIPDVLVKLKRLATVLEFKLEFKDVDGKGLNVTVMPFVKDGTVFTLRLPDSVDLTAAYTDSTIPRTPAKNRSHLVSTNEEVLKAYYAGEFNGHDDASSLKLRIIKAAFRNGEIVENK